MELHELDLNLLVVFNHLLVERRVSKVADNLGISQPAVSNSLAKLRKLFGDELFLRTPKGMEPTPYADQLAESVSYALAMIHSGVNSRRWKKPAFSCGSKPTPRSTLPDSSSSRRLTAALRTVLRVTCGASRCRRSTRAGRK